MVKKSQPTFAEARQAINEQKKSSVRIEKVMNGFVVSGYKGTYENEKTFIAKNEKEAKSLASKIL